MEIEVGLREGEQEIRAREGHLEQRGMFNPVPAELEDGRTVRSASPGSSPSWAPAFAGEQEEE
ncbi:hypothetical protein U1769_03175 [Sphingomonas sp. ZT3P38]|uniref:hypothetical protein n=1 Tax=Parasphingomonas zepuensis TaxID=3096161 RepID=UPI002FCB39E9